MTMDELIAALETAREGSRELDARIGLLVGDWKISASGKSIGVRDDKEVYRWVAFKQDEFYSEEDVIGTIIGCLSLASYTKSIDAALTLVLEGAPWTAEIGLLKSGYTAWVGPRGSTVIAKTPALALCIAALKARQGLSQTFPK